MPLFTNRQIIYLYTKMLMFNRLECNLNNCDYQLIFYRIMAAGRQTGFKCVNKFLNYVAEILLQ
jgi:hypothetical protein